MEWKLSMLKLIDQNDLPDKFEYPAAVYKLLECNLINFDVWYFMDEMNAKLRLDGLRERYPNRNLIPFARRGDCDDIACFEVGQEEKVYVIHDFATNGYEQREQFESVWDWLKYAINIMIDYEIMEGIC
jgi:hypothetical protein